MPGPHARVDRLGADQWDLQDGMPGIQHRLGLTRRAQHPSRREASRSLPMSDRSLPQPPGALPPVGPGPWTGGAPAASQPQPAWEGQPPAWAPPAASQGWVAPPPAPGPPQQWTPQQPGWAAPQPPLIIVHNNGGPGLFVRGIWFLFVGWWLSWLAIGVAYIACLTLVGLPLGFYIFNRLPMILTLRARNDRIVTEVRDGVTFLRHDHVEQLPMWVRAVYFLLVGWWLGAIYLGLAWFLCVMLVTMPIGLVMFNRVGAVMTLLRY